ncbi:hypothetical protein B7463_g3103, partial [Scytalidium lignicola]
MAVTKTFYAQDPNGTEFLEVRSKWHFGGTKMVATFLNTSTCKRTELVVKGDWFNRNATITLGNVVVAQISRKKSLFSAQQSYFVTVVPNVDLSLVAAICISLDEKDKDERSSTNAVIV